jgi:hypothetical protein
MSILPAGAEQACLKVPEFPLRPVPAIRGLEKEEAGNPKRLKPGASNSVNY